MDEMSLGRSKYISTRRAAKLTGYAQDYVGQLVRQGKVKATKVGKAWFVLEDDALRLAGKPNGKESPERAIALLEKRSVTTTESVVSVSVEYPKTWSSVHYFKDDSPLIPISDNRETIGSQSNIELLDVHRVRISRSGMGVNSNENGIEGPRQGKAIRMSSFDGVRYSVSEDRGKGSSFIKDPGPSTDANLIELESKILVGGMSGGDRSSGVGSWFFKVLISALIVSVFVFLVPLF